MNNNKSTFLLTFVTCIVLLSVSCKRWDNFTTYYNTYYNQERLLTESQNEFEYQTEQVKNNPRVVIPDSSLFSSKFDKSVVPPFMVEYIITKQQRQAVENKIDSILIKGSKILARHPKSDYMVKTLYNIALAYYYKNEWLPAQIKCAEIVDKFPENNIAPDALILFSKTLLIQRKFDQAEVMLSRTVDLAWALQRYDILSQAFRLQAETKLYLNELDEAVKPYKQAIVQSDDKSLKARWQLDLALLLYRIGKFERAISELSKVMNFSPDYITTFETKLYTANSLSFLGKYDLAEKILNDLDNDGKYEEWKASTFAGKMLLEKQRGDYTKMESMEKLADSLYVNNPAIIAVYYQRGKDLYDTSDYNRALQYFSRARVTRTPVFNSANKMHTVLNNWKLKQAQIYSPMQSLASGQKLNDSTQSALAKNLFELGRVHEQLNNEDSVIHYYKKAIEFANPNEAETAKYLYVYALKIENKDLRLSDSLMDIIATKYSLTDYGKDAMKRMGYTKAFIIDTARELFESGTELMLHKEYAYAIRQYNTLLNNYPGNKYEPRTLYSVGWMYERRLRQYDSALYYYKLLVERYPDSEYAKDIKLAVEYLAANQSGEPIPEHLKERKKLDYLPERNLDELKAPPIPALQMKPPQQEPGMNIQDLFSDPTKILKQFQNSLQDQIDNVKTLDPTKQLDSLKKQFSLDSLTNIKIDQIQTLPKDTTKHN